ncbi:MAG: phosphomevalonate kinase [Bogoriella megaspora]|nr:MAG: phosphomevalonate kinase [Bogoriella megaspora]
MPLPRTAVSAPGKVLLAGGYLVLDRDYTGLVFGLDARIHAIIQPLPTSPGVTLSEIIVQSPQFKEASWSYGYRLADHDGGIHITQLRVAAESSLHRNPFLDTTIGFALSYIGTLVSPSFQPVSIIILADNDYYSKPSKGGRSQPVAKRGRFMDFEVPLWEAHKTGLGSSAALVTAVTAALLSHYLPQDTFSLANEAEKKRLHNLSQAAHCAAQGKVGSGFDVASAVYGSCLYRRFSPSLLEHLSTPGSRGFSTRLKCLVEQSNQGSIWDTEILKSAVAVPKGIRLVMCDVDCGSQTPGMVKKVLAWRKENSDEANTLWARLHACNEGLALKLKGLTEGKAETLSDIKACLAEIRGNIRQMSTLSDVPIEPPSQTKLLNACESIPGVIGGVVPGAGGYDALALLIQDDEEVLNRLQSFLAGWEGTKDETEGVTIGKVGLLGVREEMEGVRSESDNTYTGWLE